MLAQQIIVFLGSVILGAGFSSTQDHVLKQHFKAHNQDNWEAFESLTAKGEWHIKTKDFFVEYSIKAPNKWTAVATEGRQRLISDQLYAGTFGLEEPEKAVPFLPAEAMALSYVWSFGSPLFSISDQLVKKENLQVDQKPCYWYQHVTEDFTYDFFITRSDHLFYKVTITNKEDEVVGSTTIAQYRKLGPYEMPAQVTIRTKKIDYLMVFTGYVIGDYVPDSRFQFD